MARPQEAKKGQKTKSFVVKEGVRIGGFDGKTKNGGDKIELTKDQAEYYMERELVKPEMPDYDDEEDDTDDDSNPHGPSRRDPAARDTTGVNEEHGEMKDPNRKENPDEQVSNDGGNTKLNPSEGGTKSETDRPGGKASGGGAGDGGTQAKRNAKL